MTQDKPHSFSVLSSSQTSPPAEGCHQRPFGPRLSLPRDLQQDQFPPRRTGQSQAPPSAFIRHRLINPANKFYSHPLPCLEIGGSLKIIFQTIKSRGMSAEWSGVCISHSSSMSNLFPWKQRPICKHCFLPLFFILCNEDIHTCSSC